MTELWSALGAMTEDHVTEARSETFYKTTTPDGDTVDKAHLVYFFGHGAYTGVVMQSSANTRDTVHPAECQWGRGSLRWMVLDACETLMWRPTSQFNGVKENTPNPLLWRSAFSGLRMILGWTVQARDVPGRGSLLGNGMMRGLTTWRAWCHCAEENAEDLADSMTACLYGESERTTSPLLDTWENGPWDAVIPERFTWFGYHDDVLKVTP